MSSEVIRALKELLASLFSDDNYISFISMIIAAMLAYLSARYSASRPSKLKIKQLQLDNVYLPLYRLTFSLPDKLTLRDAQRVYRTIDQILDEHYPLVFPQLHRLNAEFGIAISNDMDYSSIFVVIKHQVAIDYELSKKALGYPSENIFNIFIRMTCKQKASIFVSFLNSFWYIFPCFYAYPLFNGLHYWGLLLLFLSYAGLAFTVRKINQLIDRV